MSEKKIYVIHENDEWLEPLRAAFDEQRLSFEEWFAADGWMSLDESPPDGVFYNRMSASSHIRNHRFAPEQTGILLEWLTSHGRRVVNGSRALQLEVSKAAQYAALNAAGIETPRTLVAVGRQAVIDAAKRFGPEPIILKPNRGGSGKGVHLFDKFDALVEFVESADYEAPLDGVSLVQEYVQSPERFITRVEVIGGELLYAVRVDTGGSFELCPADPCAIPSPPGSDRSTAPSFTILEHVDPQLVQRFRRFFTTNDIEIGAVEFVTDVSGRVFAYDVNTNTNYNRGAEERAGKYGMREVARFLETLLTEDGSGIGIRR